MKDFSEAYIPIITGAIAALSTWFVTRSNNKTDIEKEMQKVNIQNATALYEQYMATNNKLQEKVDKLEEKIEKLNEKYEKEIQFYKLEIDKLETRIEELEDENERLAEEIEDYKKGNS